MRYIVKVTEICANIDFATTPARKEYLISLAILAIGIQLLALAKKFNKKDNVRILLKLSASAMVLLSVCSAFLFFNASPKNEISIQSVGKGTCVLIKTESKVFAIGAGDSLTDYNKVESSMTKMCRHSIDHIIIPTANKSFAAGAPEMILQNPNAKIIYPNAGDYTDKLDYISNENFKTFDYKISFEVSNTEIITYANVGTTVNFTDRSLIIYTGMGDINVLFQECKKENPILICSNSLNQKLEFEVSDCIINGSDEAKKAIGNVLKKQSISFKAVDSKPVSIEF